MKKMIEAFILLAALALVMGCVTGGTPRVTYTDPENFEYEIVGTGENRTITITRCKFRQKNIRIPPIIDGLPVTAIGEKVFYVDPYTRTQLPKLTSVTIPESVTSIGRLAFANNELKSIIIPEGVTSLEDFVFWKNQLASVTIPEGVTSIGEQTFSENQLTSVIIPGSVVSIGDGAFYGNQLTSITIPEGVTSLEDGAFNGNQLTGVIIPGSVTSIGNSAFWGNQLSSVTIPEGVASIGDRAFEHNQLTSVTIPGSVASIGVNAFRDNRLSNITIQEGVTSIGEYAFVNNSCKTITIPDSVTSIGDKAFAQMGQMDNDVRLDSLTMSMLRNISIEKVFGEECEIDNLTITSGRIPANAFNGMGLKSVTLLEGVTSVGNKAFGNNVTLAKVTIPASLKSFAHAFDAGDSSGYWVTYGKGSGIYERKDFKYYHNDVPLTPAPAWIFGGTVGVRIASIDGRNTIYPNIIPASPGFHEIAVSYHMYTSEGETYSEGPPAVLKYTLVEGGFYDITGTIQDDEIMYEIKKRE